MNMKLDYDEQYDILYVAFADKSNSYQVDQNRGFLVALDEDTKKITGCTIMDFSKKLHDKCFIFAFNEMMKDLFGKAIEQIPITKNPTLENPFNYDNFYDNFDLPITRKEKIVISPLGEDDDERGDTTDNK